MLKRLSAASDVATLLILVTLGLAAKEAWRSGFDPLRVGALISVAPIVGALALLLCLLLVPSLFEPGRFTWREALTMPAIHGALTLMVSKMISTQSHAVVATQEVLAPIEHWLNPAALVWMVGIEVVALGTLAALRGRNGGEPVS